MAGTVSPTFIQHRSRGVVRSEVSITCDAAGDASATVVGVGFGILRSIFYNGGLDASATITLKDSKTGATLVTITTGVEGTPATYPVTQVIKDNAGVAVAAAATAPNVNRPIVLAGKVTITVAGGGVSETATLALVIDEARLGDLALTV